jgi:hypothetical protein
MNVRILTGTVLAALSATHVAQAACSVPSSVSVSLNGNGWFDVSPNRPSTSASEDNFYASAICDEGFSDEVWSHYNMDKSNWDDGRGYDNYCDTTRMLGRTYAGLWVLNWSAPSPATTWDDFSGNALKWGGNYAAREMDELDGTCSWPSSWGKTTHGGIFVDEKTEVYKGFVYELTPAGRARTLIHEARHADGEDSASHDGNDGSNACPAGGSSCDENYSSTWSGRANSIEAWYASWYWSTAINTTTLQRNSIRDMGNWNLDNRFDNDPGWNI